MEKFQPSSNLATSSLCTGCALSFSRGVVMCQGQLSSTILALCWCQTAKEGHAPPRMWWRGVKLPEGGRGKGLERYPVLLNQLSASEIIWALPFCAPPPTVGEGATAEQEGITQEFGEISTPLQSSLLPGRLLTREIKGIRSL